MTFQQRLQRLANYDYFPNFSAHVRRTLYNPLGVLLLAAIVALLCGAFLHAQGFVLGGGLLFVVFLGVCWPWLTLRGLQAALEFANPRGREGETVAVQLRIGNRWWWPAFGLAVKGGFGTDATQPVAACAVVPRRRMVVCQWSLTPPCRGIYPTTPPRLSTGFPFGLWENRRAVQTPTELLVWPRIYPVGPMPPVSGDRQVEGNVTRNQVGTGGDFMGVRPYRRGDSPRRIHWAQSARHDRLIVCELQMNSRPLIQIVLDTEASVHAGEGAQSSFEWAVRMAASFAYGWLEHGAQVGLVYGEQDIAPASGAVQTTRLLDELARVTTTTTPLAQVLTCPHCRGFRDGLQVIITTDLAAHHACAVCVAEEQRWVILASSVFTHEHTATCTHGHHPQAWLYVDSAAAIPTLLRSGWREAQHGS